MSRILLADDSPHAQRMGERILREEGFEVVSVTDGDTAAVRLRDVDPDVVVADVEMPGRNGYELCRLVKASAASRHTRVILTAGLLEPFDENLAREVGADGVLRKPFEASSMAAAVRSLAREAQILRTATGRDPSPIDTGPIAALAATTPVCKPASGPAQAGALPAAVPRPVRSGEACPESAPPQLPEPGVAPPVLTAGPGAAAPMAGEAWPVEATPAAAPQPVPVPVPPVTPAEVAAVLPQVESVIRPTPRSADAVPAAVAPIEGGAAPVPLGEPVAAAATAILPALEAIPTAHPKPAEWVKEPVLVAPVAPPQAAPRVDPERVRAAVTVALDAALPRMIDEITKRVLVALTD